MVTTFPEMAKSMQPLFPLASTLNISLEDLFGSMATLTGVTGNTAEVSTQLKAVFSNLIKPTKDMQKLISDYGYSNGQAMIESEGLSGVLKILQKETGGSSDKMGKLFSSTEALTAILALTGDQYDTFVDKSGQMNKSLGATDKALEKVEATSKDKLMKSLNELKNSFINLGGAAAPIIEKVSDAMSKAADVIGNMDEKTLSTIVNVTSMGLAFGVTGKAVGSTISTVGSLSQGLSGLITFLQGSSKDATKASVALGGMSKVTSAVGTAGGVAAGATGLGGLVTTLGGLVLAATPWILAGGAMIATVSSINKSLNEEAIPAVDLFADHVEITGTKMTEYGEVIETTTTKISAETAKQVQSYLDLDESAQYALNDLYYSSQIITDETVNGMTEKYSAMGTAITTKLAEDKAKDTEVLSKFFANSKVLLEEDEAETLRLMQEGYDKKSQTVTDAQSKMIEIITNASNEKRELKDSELKEISKLQEDMKVIAINTLSEQEKEAQVILDRMKAYDGRVTAEQASEHIKNFNNQRDKAVDAANSEYREVVSAIETMRDDLGQITAEQAEDLIKSAELQRDKTIDAAKDTRDKAVEKIKDMNEQIEDDVDTTTGDILTFWDKMQRKWDEWFPKKKTFTTETIETKTTVQKTKKEPPQKGYRLDEKLNNTIYRQLQNNIVRGLNTQTYARLRQPNNNVTVAPEFEGVIKIQVNDGKMISKNIKFIDKSLNKRRNNLSFGGLE